MITSHERTRQNAKENAQECLLPQGLSGPEGITQAECQGRSWGHQCGGHPLC